MSSSKSVVSNGIKMNWKWSHATNSLEKVVQASIDPSISAVECDVVLGTATERGTRFPDTPILAHPPNIQSDISVATLILELTKRGENGQRELRKHLKLDFKEIGAVKPSLELLQLSNISNPLGKEIFLNADILPGPGKRDDKTRPMSSDSFLSCCLNHIRSRKDPNVFYSFSLGYSCDYAKNEPYQHVDIMRMAEIVTRNGIRTDSDIGLVIALNARCLALDPRAFDGFLWEFPRSTILAWTGSGEPRIPFALVDKICRHFEEQGMHDRISFDCEVEDSKDISRYNQPDCAILFYVGLPLGIAIGAGIGFALAGTSQSRKSL